MIRVESKFINDALFCSVVLGIILIGGYAALSGLSFMFWLTQPASPETVIYMAGKSSCKAVEGYFADGKERSRCWEGIEQTEAEFQKELMIRYAGPLEQLKTRNCTFHYYAPLVKIASSLVCGDQSFSEKEWPKVIQPWAVSKAAIQAAGCDVYQYNSYLQPVSLLCPASGRSEHAGAGGPAMEIVTLSDFISKQSKGMSPFY